MACWARLAWLGFCCVQPPFFWWWGVDAFFVCGFASLSLWVPTQSPPPSSFLPSFPPSFLPSGPPHSETPPTSTPPPPHHHQTIRATTIEHPPIFILGHFRSGTTRLHELMSKDARLVAPTVYQCFAPRVFLHREEAISAQFGRLQLRRPMDSVKVKVRA